MASPRQKDLIPLYGLYWDPLMPPLVREMHMVSKGGSWKNAKGVMVGRGVEFHMKAGIEILWPDFAQHRWFDLFLHEWLRHKYVGVIGPKNCVAGNTKILNPLTGEQPTIEELYLSEVEPVVLTRSGPALASVPFIKGKTELYEVQLRNGHSFRATASHRVLSAHGFVSVSSLRPGELLLSCAPSHQASTSELCRSVRLLDGPHSSKTVQDFQFDCPAYSCFCDEQLPSSGATFRGVFPSPTDVPTCDSGNRPLRSGAQANRPSRNHLDQQIFHLASSPLLLPCDIAETAHSHLVLSGTHARRDGSCGFGARCAQAIPLRSPSSKSSLGFSRPRRFPFSWVEFKDQQTVVQSIKPVGVDFFFDLQVPDYHHYFAEGAFHHNSGKTAGAAVIHLFDYYCFPDQTTVLCCSTTMEMLENRIFGELKKRHRAAKTQYSWIPGHLIEGRQRIVTDARDEVKEGRDMRNGLQGIPLKLGNAHQGMSSIIGIKNKRKRICADEIQCLPRSLIDSMANFMEPGADCKITGMGNPAETTDSLGILCEPHVTLGGWEGGIDQTPNTKTWKTRFESGICIQFPGSDSPNYDAKPEDPVPYPFLMTREQMRQDAETWGKMDWHYTMFNEGRMPHGQGANRIITRQLCMKHGALLPPSWANSKRTKIIFLDAAFRAVGGDRCVFGELDYGEEMPPPIENGVLNASALVDQPDPKKPKRQIMALIDMLTIPIKASDFESPEDQIVMFVKKEAELRDIPPENFYFDAGMRTSLVTAFSRLWSPNVNSIDFGGSPSDRKVSGNIDVICSDYYKKFVTELWYSARLIIESSQFRGLTEEVMLEGCAREWKQSSNNKIEIETKAEMKEKTGRSPDLFDALVCGIEGARQKGFIIQRMIAAEAARRDDRWKREMKEKAAGFWKAGQLTATST